MSAKKTASPEKTTAVKQVSTKSESHKGQVGKTWGRARDVGFGPIFTATMIMTLSPILPVFLWLSCHHYGGSILAPIQDIINNGIEEFARKSIPRPTQPGFILFFSWLAFQAMLYQFLPGKIGYGQRTPAGHILPYVVNGLSAWIVTHVSYFIASEYFHLFPSSLIHDNWGGLLVAANVYGYALTLFSYIKAYVAPSHPDDRKFSSSSLYDMFWGIEFNPRLGKWFDFKLFHNGRPGIVGWTLINMSFAAAQYAKIGYITNSMIIVNWLHLVYVIDFFYNEDWYLRTIDIAHDHFGFYLAWGDSVWLPFLYTLQTHYLVVNPVQLSVPYALSVLALGSLGYYVFRETNNQKDIVRKSDGKCKIWGNPARIIRPKYVTSDGKEHSSILLTSGFWGLSRHFNYVGDLMMSTAMCMACGFEHVLPYFYIVFMTILLVSRVYRDHDRCSGKYGKYWDQYCKAVPYKLIPYVF